MMKNTRANESAFSVYRNKKKRNNGKRNVQKLPYKRKNVKIEKTNKPSSSNHILKSTARAQLNEQKETIKNGFEAINVPNGPNPPSETTKPQISHPIDGIITAYDQGRQLLSWLIAPVTMKEFFNNFWEKNALFIKRNKSDYFNFFDTKTLDMILRRNSLHFTRNVDIVSYTDGKRETHNPEGRALPAIVWDYYLNGCSVRILNPQTYAHKVHALLATLQEYFGTMVGANVYLTPPNSQGFAPHYDDIEAFVIQLEGCKHWKLYPPKTPSEVLPRFSSGNFNAEELGKPLKEVTLNAGDVLYMPRGTIHEGCTTEQHSLHITVSVYQKTSYGDLIEHLLPLALNTAVHEDVEYRQGLPLHYLQHVGMTHAENTTQIRQKIIKKVTDLMTRLIEYAPIDAAADKLGVQFMHDALPPFLSDYEKKCTVAEDGDRLENGKIINRAEIGLDTKIRLLRRHCLWLAAENENLARIYYCTDNTKVYHGEEQQFLDIDFKFISGIEFLIKRYPSFEEVNNLPIDNDVDKMQLIADLWEKGLVMTAEPLIGKN